MRIEGGDEHERFVEEARDPVAVGDDAARAVLGERDARVADQA